MAILGEKRLFQLPKNGHLLELLKGIPQLQEFAIALQSLLGYGDGWSDDGSGDNKMTHIIDDPLSLLIHYWWYRYTPLIHYWYPIDPPLFGYGYPWIFPMVSRMVSIRNIQNGSATTRPAILWIGPALGKKRWSPARWDSPVKNIWVSPLHILIFHSSI